MTFQCFDLVYDATLSLLPSQFDSAEARAMLMMIGLQESRFEYRRQINGPAHGWWQFELGGGVHGVLHHKMSHRHIRDILNALGYGNSATESYLAIEHNDILACAYARLLLWTLPQPLPQRGQVEEAWRQYIEAWRPGKPHPETWRDFHDQAWTVVIQGD